MFEHRASLRTPIQRAVRALRRSKQGQRTLSELSRELDLDKSVNTSKNVWEAAQRERARKKESSLETLVPHFSKLSQLLGSAFEEPQPQQAGRGVGNFTPNRPKKPGMTVRRQAVNPRLRLTDAMNKGIA